MKQIEELVCLEVLLDFSNVKVSNICCLFSDVEMLSNINPDSVPVSK